jgi:hypothetical protein
VSGFPLIVVLPAGVGGYPSVRHQERFSITNVENDEREGAQVGNGERGRARRAWLLLVAKKSIFPLFVLPAGVGGYPSARHQERFSITNVENDESGFMSRMGRGRRMPRMTRGDA